MPQVASRVSSGRPNYRALQGHADGRSDEEGHRQRHQRVERQGFRGETLEQHLHHIGGVGPEHQHLAVGHVDNPEQAEGDGQTQRRQQQDRTQRQAAKGLAEQFTDQQFAFDLGQAGFGGGAHRRVAFHGRVEQGFQAGAGQRVAGFTEQAHGGQANGRVVVDQLQVGQGQGQGIAYAIIGFAGDAGVK